MMMLIMLKKDFKSHFDTALVISNCVSHINLVLLPSVVVRIKLHKKTKSGFKNLQFRLKNKQ